MNTQKKTKLDILNATSLTNVGITTLKYTIWKMHIYINIVKYNNTFS